MGGDESGGSESGGHSDPLEPLLAAIVAWLWLGQELSVLQSAGGLLAIAAVGSRYSWGPGAHWWHRNRNYRAISARVSGSAIKRDCCRPRMSSTLRTRATGENGLVK